MCFTAEAFTASSLMLGGQYATKPPPSHAPSPRTGSPYCSVLTFPVLCSAVSVLLCRRASLVFIPYLASFLKTDGSALNRLYILNLISLLGHMTYSHGSYVNVSS